MKITRNVYFGLSSLLVAIGALVALNVSGSTSQAISSFRNCNADAIITCGAISESELLQDYDANKGDVQAIYSHYGISRSDIAGTTSTIKHGTVYQDGRVVVNGETVATGAYSVSRVRYTSAGTPRNVVINGTTYYEGPSMQIFTGPVDAFVMYRNGQFYRAVLSSCGNPLMATPKTPPVQPVYTCDSLVSRKIERNKFEFTSSATIKNDDRARVVSYNYDFGDGVKLNNAAKTVTHVYNTTVAKTYTATMTANIDINGTIKVVSGPNCQTPVKVEAVTVTPLFACEGLTATKKIGSRTEYTFEASASATNATIKSYTFKFGDGNSKVVTTSAKTASTTHEYSDKAASYTAEVIVTMSDGKIATSTACKAPVKVEEKPTEKNPSVTIEKTVNGKEHAKVAVGTEFTYEITVRNTGNVVLKDAVVTDTAPSQVTLVSAAVGKIEGNKWTYTISQLNIGASKSFTIKAKYAKYMSGTHKNTVCVDTPTIPATSPDSCDSATTETSEKIVVCDLNDNTIKTIDRSQYDESHMTTDTNKCGEMKVCIIESKTVKTIAKSEYDTSTMTTDMSKCEVTVVTPPELPLTGAETFIGGGLGLGSLTAASYYWVASRKNLLSALLNK